MRLLVLKSLRQLAASSGVALMEETNIAPFLSHQERGHGEREEKNGILAL